MRLSCSASVLLAFLLTSACSVPLQSESGRTGLEGTISRGPVRPVCLLDEPCDAPMPGEFSLQQGGRVVVRFSSDSSGHFQVYAPPGNYEVVPGRPVGIVPQTPGVTVGPTGITHADITFDTGIR